MHKIIVLTHRCLDGASPLSEVVLSCAQPVSRPRWNGIDCPTEIRLFSCKKCIHPTHSAIFPSPVSAARGTPGKALRWLRLPGTASPDVRPISAKCKHLELRVSVRRVAVASSRRMPAEQTSRNSDLSYSSVIGLGHTCTHTHTHPSAHDAR